MHRAVAALFLAVLVIDSTGGVSMAQATPAQADRVEEDWELVIASPDLVGVGPQITTSMSPTGDLTAAPFATFNLNYREYPTFQPGGLQVQVWSGKQLLSSSSQESAPCTTVNETITWTQRMDRIGDGVFYWIKAGQSTTWGQFGEYFQLSAYLDSSADSLAGYSPAVSVANSGVGWQSDLVTSMTLLRVRYYANGELIATDETSRPIPLNN